jgi:hypothetical protein
MMMSNAVATAALEVLRDERLLKGIPLEVLTPRVFPLLLPFV